VNNFFPGSWEEAKRTFVIGTPEQMVEQMQAQTARLGRKSDAFLLTPFSADRHQLELIQSRVAPLLREANKKA
jgi:alkanesulfonate monooxygenase SsuD/methylene tetrahydromethanopterin reductase-like flavin-dependent oxidoreductase (luciferase family)